MFKHLLPLVKSIANKSLFFPIIGIVTLLLSILCAEYFFHKATLTVFLPSQTIQKNITVLGQMKNKSPDSVFISMATYSAKLTESASVTGKRDIGEKAKGEVTFYNYDDVDKIIALATDIKVDSFVFQTTTEVKVPGATLANDASAKLPGKSKVSVVARLIGSENNLEKNKRFHVGDFPFSTLFAINESAFSGGTKSSVTTVSKKDIDDLKQILITKAKKTPQSTDVKQLSKDSDVLADLTEVNLTDITSSKEVGEEGNKVSVQTMAITRYYYFSKENMKKTILSQLKELIPSGFRLDTHNISYQIKKNSKEDDEFTLFVSAKAKSIKDIDTNKIPKLIHGKQKNQIALLLKNEFGLSDYSLEILPNLPLINSILPFFKKNISLISQDL